MNEPTVETGPHWVKNWRVDADGYGKAEYDIVLSGWIGTADEAREMAETLLRLVDEGPPEDT